MHSSNTKDRIKKHYDLLSPYYQKLWGIHIHHGYYITGKESKQEATDKLIKLLASKLNIKKSSLILDIGCGIGGTSIYFAKKYNCKVTGITISAVQAKMAEELSKQEKLKMTPKFSVEDANNLSTKKKYEILWSVEMISHLQNKKLFFERCAKILKKKGRFAIADWFMADNLNQSEIMKYIKPIENDMLVSLWTSREYIDILEKNGLKLKYHKDISNNVKKTWDVSLEIIKNKELWSLARNHSKEFTNFLKAFKSMKNGFKSGAFKYEALIFEK
ncbi:MAG: class I SAM-dependent methyltransferase [Candidatus Micrarchaeaceae archaeon]|jgi:tocopherol O-methyltransferase